MDLDQRIATIQRSTRTSIPFFIPSHNILRMRFRWYYRWHLFPMANFVHFAILFIFTLASIWGIYNESIPGTIATPSTSITITDKVEWQAQTYDNEIIDTETAPGSVKLLQGKDGYSSGYFGSCVGNNSTGQINSWDSLYFQFPLQVENFPADVSSARLWLYANHGFWNSANATPPDPRYVDYSISGIGSNWTENPMTCPPSGNGYSKTGTIDMSLYSQCYGTWAETPEGPCMGDFFPNTYIPFELDGGTPAEVAEKWAGWGMRAQITHLDGLNINLREYDNHPPKLEINFANGDTWNVNLPVQSGAQSGTILSAPTQLDGGENFTSWSTLTSQATISANTSISYRFRTSDDTLSWTTWTESTPYAASINLATLLGDADKTKRYLQVEATLANTDGASTPILQSYTANIAEAICPAGTTQGDGNIILDTTAEWDAGTKLNTNTSNDVIEISDTAGKLDLEAIYNSDPSTVSTVMDWAVETGDKANPLDGDTGTFWGFTGPSPASTGNDDGNPFANAYWLMDLKQTYNLSQMRMYMNNDPDWPTDYSFQFAISDDGINYEDIITTTESQAHQQWHSFDISAETRYVRLHIDAGGWTSVRNLAEIELYGNATAIHTGAAAQLDGTADIASWTTFVPVATVPENTNLSFRFRTSEDASNWGSWSSSAGHAENIELASLLSETDITYRYLQVETTLTNTDGASTPTLNSYTANYIICTPDEPSPTCNDGIQNGDETGVDCGGSCVACPTCSDGIQNQGEEDVDCGGPCEACPIPPTCTDGIQNQGETGVDCGGPCEACILPETCDDRIRNQNETGVDCGGVCPACIIPETCSDGIKNQNETGIDCGGVCGECPKECKLQECLSEASIDMSSCQSQAIAIGASTQDCISDYCNDTRACYRACGYNEAVEQHTFLKTPNGGESYDINSDVAVRWHYTDSSKKIKVAIDNIAVKLSISTDSGQTYRAIKALLPKDKVNSTFVKQYRLGDDSLPIGTYSKMRDGFTLEYIWQPADPSFVSSKVRIRLEPMQYNCVIALHSDSSDNDFSLTTSSPSEILTLTVSPVSHKVEPDQDASYVAKAYWNGADVTASTNFSYKVQEIASIRSSNKNQVTLIAGREEGYFDRALEITASYTGAETLAYAALEIESTLIEEPDPEPVCDTWICRLFKDTGIKGTGSTSSESAAMLLAALIGLVNSMMNMVSLFKEVIAPLIKGKEKKRNKSVVYDALTGLPVAGAKVMLVSHGLNTLVAVAISDKDGKYSLELSPGKEYLVKVEKDNFMQYIGGSHTIEQEGLPYENSYLGKPFMTEPDQYVFQQNIPMLEVKTEVSVQDLLHRNRNKMILTALNTSILLIGSGLALIIFINFPTTINYIVMALYVLILFYHLIHRYVLSGKSYGQVSNISEDNRPVDLTIIRAISSTDFRLVRTVISDIKGRFTMTLPKGKYRLFANKEGLVQSENLAIEVNSSFTPRHDTIRMKTSETKTEAKSIEGPKPSIAAVNSASELISSYKESKKA